MQEIKITELPPTIGVAELAQLLHLSPKTVQVDLCRAPDSLPPPMKRNGSQRRSNLVWVTDEVLTWMRARINPVQAPKVKPGRPNKVDQVRRQQAADGGRQR